MYQTEAIVLDGLVLLTIFQLLQLGKYTYHPTTVDGLKRKVAAPRSMPLGRCGSNAFKGNDCCLRMVSFYEELIDDPPTTMRQHLLRYSVKLSSKTMDTGGLLILDRSIPSNMYHSKQALEERRYTFSLKAFGANSLGFLYVCPIISYHMKRWPKLYLKKAWWTW